MCNLHHNSNVQIAYFHSMLCTPKHNTKLSAKMAAVGVVSPEVCRTVRQTRLRQTALCPSLWEPHAQPSCPPSWLFTCVAVVTGSRMRTLTFDFSFNYDICIIIMALFSINCINKKLILFYFPTYFNTLH